MSERRIPMTVDARGRLVIRGCACLWCRLGRSLRPHRYREA